MNNDRIMAGSLSELMTAMHKLSSFHTRDDREAGFTVDVMPSICDAHEQSEYVEAWRIVRDALGYRTKPDRRD